MCARTCRSPSLRAANSTAEAARTVSEEAGVGSAAIAPRIAGDVYGLAMLAEDIADHPGNQTRFVLVAREGVPERTGHDRTGLVIYQRADEPGSLISILQEFAARRINLSNLLSRPTKDGGLGDYCFVVYADGHIADELLADAIRSLQGQARQGQVPWVVSGVGRGRPHRPRTRRRQMARSRRLGQLPPLPNPLTRPWSSRAHPGGRETLHRGRPLASMPERWQSGQMHPP